MVSDTAIRKVQQKLNRLSLYTLGRILGKCTRGDEAHDILRAQVLLAMAHEFDSQRLTDEESNAALESVADDQWINP